MTDEWTWTYFDADATEMTGEALVTTGFPSQSDAETWLGEQWRELAEAGVEAVTLKHEGAGAPAIDSARSYILGQYPLGFETAADWAGALAELDLYGLPDSYIDEFAGALRGVDVAQSRQVIAGAFPDSDDVDIVLIGDAARIRPEAARYGALREKPLAAPDFQPPPR